MSSIRYLAEYVPFYLFTRFFSILPLKSSVQAGRRLGRLLFSIDRRHRKVAIDNLSIILDLDPVEAEGIARTVFENIGMTFAEFIKIPTLGKSFFDNNVEVDGFENYLRAKGAGKGVLMLGAHLGSWELLPACHLIKMGEAASVVYKRTKNPYVSRFIDSIRRSYGLKTIPHRNSVREIMAALRRGEGVGILLDQHAGLKEAIVVDFIGRPAATNYGLALIALKTGAPVVPMFFVREGDERYRFIYEEPIHLQKSGDSERDIREATIRFNSVIEKYVRKYPEQWFWVHIRWKADKAVKGEK
ncbi:MAG: lysophospholipid acyltransferase family protein [Deltaproteobacteria bacterium]|nr:lysophospholipid acyltransferase family protein [Deltaproteobacteria bacterium]